MHVSICTRLEQAKWAPFHLRAPGAHWKGEEIVFVVTVINYGTAIAALESSYDSIRRCAVARQDILSRDGGVGRHG